MLGIPKTGDTCPSCAAGKGESVALTLATPARAVQRVTPAPAELIAARHVLGTRSTTPPHVTALCVVDASKTGFIFTVASGVAELD